MSQVKEVTRSAPSDPSVFSENSVRRLARELERVVDGDVRFDPGTRAAYSRDASNYRQIPIGVVLPKDEEDVAAALAVCREQGVPILARGGGTSLAGQCCNVAVVFDFSGYMNRILEVNPDERWARVQPGVILDHLQDRVRQYNLRFGPDPSTHNHCTFGGMIGNNACGVRSVMSGRTVDNVHELNVLLYDGLEMQVGSTSEEEAASIVENGGRRGEIFERLRALRDVYGDKIRQYFPKVPRRVSGYCLDELLPEKGFHVARSLVGTESTCVLFSEAKVRLVDSPPFRALAVLCYDDVYAAADHVPEVLKHQPMGLESLDDRLIDYMHTKDMRLEDLKLFPLGYGGWLIAEFGGESQDEANQRAQAAGSALQGPSGCRKIEFYQDRSQQDKIWEIREAGLAATAFVPHHHDAWPGWEDSAVHPEKLGRYLRDFRKLLEKHRYDCSFYGHFGDGLLHTRINFELRTREGIDEYHTFLHEAADLVKEYGGSYSGEHGDGQARAELLRKLYGKDLLEAFNEFKSIWDFDWKMNPGKIVEPYRTDENLALGTGYRPGGISTHFSFPEDQGDFAHATLRCVGVGLCRREEEGTMCPSYMVTRDEKHTTRGRARVLFEMLQGDVITDGWQSEEVKDALDLCLACKGCKGDCPVHVDMATYKAEFLSHYYERKWRPRTAWSMGFIDVWARLASKMPRFANFISQSPALSSLSKWAGGIAQEREMPAFAAEPFTRWFHNRQPRNVGRPEVLLWPDTFNNYFRPEIAQAAVGVLEHAGFHVVVPQQSLCCGRPLYDYGFLDRAEKYLLDILDTLAPTIRAGVPVVVLEPSCLAVFRDELTNLLPHDEHARRLQMQALTLPEFVMKHRNEFDLPGLPHHAILHGHCHEKAIVSMDSTEELLNSINLDYQHLDSGCCGMAGSFGFEEGHYDISTACGERVLLPQVRNAADETLIVADGFSCQEQIRQLTNREALHTAQVLEMAIRGNSARIGRHPEEEFIVPHHKARLSGKHIAITTASACAGMLIGTWLARKVHSSY